MKLLYQHSFIFTTWACTNQLLYQHSFIFTTGACTNQLLYQDSFIFTTWACTNQPILFKGTQLWAFFFLHFFRPSCLIVLHNLKKTIVADDRLMIIWVIFGSFTSTTNEQMFFRINVIGCKSAAYNHCLQHFPPQKTLRLYSWKKHKMGLSVKSQSRPRYV